MENWNGDLNYRIKISFIQVFIDAYYKIVLTTSFGFPDNNISQSRYFIPVIRLPKITRWTLNLTKHKLLIYSANMCIVPT